MRKISTTSTTLNTNMMNSNVQLLKYNIAPSVSAFSTMRGADTDGGAYDGFNINAFCGDTKEHIAKCKDILAKEIEIAEEKILLPHQVHGVDFQIITPDFLTLPAHEQAMTLDGVDGVFTQMAGVCIGVSTADCIPLIIYDTEHHAACAIHAGWRGTVQYIALKAVKEMQTAFRSNPKKLKAVIGPGIQLRSFEVGQEVYDQFASANFDMNKIATHMAKWHIDLPLCNKLQLIRAGIDEDNIILSDIDTFTSHDFFSARRQGVKSGRIYTAIILEDIK